MCWWKVEKKEMSFLLREVAESWGWKKRHWGQRDSTKHNLFLCFIFAVPVISFSLSWSSMVEIILFTCCVGEISGICCTIHPVSPQYLQGICTKRCQSGAGQGGCSGTGTCSRCTKISRSLPSPSELQGYFIGVVQLAAVLFWSRGKAWGGVCCAASMLPSLKAGEHSGPARAGSGEQDFFLSLGHGIPDKLAFCPWDSHPSFTLSWLKPSQTEKEQPVTPLLLERLWSGIWI